MSENRPNPDQLLSAVQSEERSGGQLRVYMGYAAGVGKSYAMLKNAHELKKQGVEVVVGYLEPHGRAETESLLEGLEVLAPKKISAAGAAFQEFDLDAALARRPQIILVDELAHTNSPGCRHTKRWQDIEELLQAGMSVHTTLNVQHLSSLNDIVAQITGVQVRETIPDSVFDKASEVTLVDISPDELIKRFKSGKVYRAAQAQVAMGHYFKKSNLVALRELALRRTAERVHADVTEARLSANIQTVMPTHERLACLIDSDEGTLSAMRATARLAAGLQCPWVALDVSSTRQLTRMPTEQDAADKQTRLAEELGGKIIRRSGTFFIGEVLRFAREENITKLIIARPRRFQFEKWIERLLLFFFGHDLNILWIHPAKLNDLPRKTPPLNTAGIKLRPYIETTGIVLVSFGIAALLGLLNAPEANLAIIYLLAVIIAAVIHGEGASAYAAILSSFILSFGLTNFTWRASWFNAQYLVSFGLSLAIGLIASQMTSRLKNQAELARQERELAESLYNFTTLLTSTTGLHQIVATAQMYLTERLERSVIILVPGPQGSFEPLLKGPTDFEKDSSNFAVADWVAANNLPAGNGTQTLPEARALYLPVKSAESVVAVVAIVKKPKARPIDITTVKKFMHPLAAKLESAQIIENAENIYWQAERDRLRGDLLSSVSEGLKMPLTVLAMSCTELVAESAGELTQKQNELIQLIGEESGRLQNLVNNLTQLNRLEIGKLPLKLQSLDLNEFISDEVFKHERLTGFHPITLNLHPQPLQVSIDPLLFGQVIFNILDNVVQYTPRNTAITITTQKTPSSTRLIIEDEGDGIPEAHLEKIFEKYYRLSSRTRGAGLGLTVCRAIVTAHGARLWAENRHPQGLRMVVEIGTK